MATALDIIKRSMRLIHVLDADEEPSASESADALAAMNDMLDSWSTDRAYIFTIKEDSVTWPTATQSRTIGATGNFVTTRPTKIGGSSYFTDANSNDYILEQLATKAAYSAIVAKSTSSTLPQYMYYEPSFPDGTLYIWPVPDTSLTIKLHSPEQLTQFTALTTPVSFPPGYKHAFTTSVAEEIAPEFGVAVPPEVAKSAFKSRTKIRRLNRVVPVSQVEVSAFSQGRSFNIFTGD